MTTAVYPGSFDPVTNGHLDIIKRAAKLFDKLIVAVLVNSSKKPLFSVEERVEMLKTTIPEVAGCCIEVTFFDGLLVDFTKSIGANVIVKGLRAVSDFEYEFQMALVNRKIAPDIETAFLTTNENNMYLSSSIVKEVCRLGGDISEFVPEIVKTASMEKLLKRHGL